MSVEDVVRAVSKHPSWRIDSERLMYDTDRHLLVGLFGLRVLC